MSGLATDRLGILNLSEVVLETVGEIDKAARAMSGRKKTMGCAKFRFIAVSESNLS